MGHKYFVIRVIEPKISIHPYTVSARDKKDALRILSARLGVKIIQYEFVK